MTPAGVFASMGNHLFTTTVLVAALHRDAEDPRSVHDMGGSILPMLTERGMAVTPRGGGGNTDGSVRLD